MSYIDVMCVLPVQMSGKVMFIHIVLNSESHTSTLCVFCLCRRPAKWSIVSEVAQNARVPIIGNGDLLTHYEVAHWRAEAGCLALMTGRGALTKPWLFQEVAEVPVLDLPFKLSGATIWQSKSEQSKSKLTNIYMP